MKEVSDKIISIRNDYKSRQLDEHHVNSNAIHQFSAWMHESLESKVYEPHAFVLSTVSKDHRPSSRVLLLRGIGEDGFRFFTNYMSKKGQDLLQNPYACMNFFWPDLERQVRIEGLVEKLSEADSEEYFYSRPFESQVGAWASKQSNILKSRRELDERYAELLLKYKEEPLLKPDYWGGYLLKPDCIEFWQGRESRLHDRLMYNKVKDNWEIVRISP